MAENQNTPVRNDELLEAIAEMRKEGNFNTQTQSKVINLALRSTFIVPAIIEKNTQLVADNDNHLKFQDKPQAKFMLIKHKTNGTFFPAFTDEDELAKLKVSEDQGNFSKVKMKFSDIATLTDRTPSVAGFVVNPASTNLPFSQNMLDQIKDTLRKAREQAAANQNQNISVSEGSAQQGETSASGDANISVSSDSSDE